MERLSRVFSTDTSSDPRNRLNKGFTGAVAEMRLPFCFISTGGKHEILEAGYSDLKIKKGLNSAPFNHRSYLFHAARTVILS